MSASAGSRRNGRGQLSSIDLLPEQADEAIAWANAQLRERTMPQQEILRQFNAMLADHGIGAISRSAFSRHSVRTAIELRKYEATRTLTETVLSRLDLVDRSDAMIVATELVKARILDLALDADDNPKLLLETSLALQRLSSTAAREAEAQRRAAKDQRQADQEAKDQAEKDRADAEAASKIDRAGHEAGLSAESIAAIRKGVLGIGG